MSVSKRQRDDKIDMQWGPPPQDMEFQLRQNIESQIQELDVVTSCRGNEHTSHTRILVQQLNESLVGVNYDAYYQMELNLQNIGLKIKMKGSRSTWQD